MTKSNVDVVASEVATLKKQMANVIKEISAMNTVDALQNQKLETLSKIVTNMDVKLDTVVTFIAETRGGKKWVFGVLSTIGAVMGIAVAYLKLK